jgi:hypothetical protein
MLQYKPFTLKYPGDDKCPKSTQQQTELRPGAVPSQSRKRKTRPDDTSIASVITVNHLKHSDEHLCGFLDKLCNHIQARGTFDRHNKQCCVVCGHLTQEKCSKCNVPLHYTNTTNGGKVPCFFQYHNTSFFGLCKEDWRITPFKKGSFTIPDEDTVAKHAEVMKELHAEAVNRSNYTPPEVTDSNSSNNDAIIDDSSTPDENEGMNQHEQCDQGSSEPE